MDADAGNESNYWEVQGSADGKDFHTIALVLGFDPGKKGEQYSFKGKITRPENIFYRVAHISLTGSDIQYSNMIRRKKTRIIFCINFAETLNLPLKI